MKYKGHSFLVINLTVSTSQYIEMVKYEIITNPFMRWNTHGICLLVVSQEAIDQLTDSQHDEVNRILDDIGIELGHLEDSKLKSLIDFNLNSESIAIIQYNRLMGLPTFYGLVKE